MRVEGKVAIVTGGAQGIGRAIALGMGREGAKVVVADLQGSKARAVAGELHALGSEAHSVEVDVSKEPTVIALVKQTLSRFGRVDILVNGAGIYPHSSVPEMKEEEWDRVIDINLGGNFLCSRGVVPSMRAQKSGRIISISSRIAHQGALGGAHYAASKAGIIGFVKALARELAPDRITVNAICPGLTDTALPRATQTEEVLKERLNRNPLGHALRPEDHVGTVLFLASEAASYITGQAININCGSLML
ncbi:MAG: SDR family oxidoreductase [Deltaproteobacteria bacterium]|nr:SDR family oxidoreductase [Deltaproteobacteria bacterium]